MLSFGMKRRRTTLLLALALLSAIYVLAGLRENSQPLHDRHDEAAPGLGIRSVYIASVLWNSDSTLKHWVPELLRLVQELRASGVTTYVSIYESGSWDGTKAILSELNSSLQRQEVNRTVQLDQPTHGDVIGQGVWETGWLKTLYGQELRRIVYLAHVRNKALEPLHTLTADGVLFDKLVFLNDVIFNATDVINLLRTRNGEYAAACALDFLNPPWNVVDKATRGSHPPGIYDDFALRDSSGSIIRSHLYPYFRSSSSRAAIAAGVPVPVQSCWNGLVAFDAAPFQTVQAPLRFRAISDSLAQFHVEASECCLIHYDNPLRSGKGVWINPTVRVGYTPEAYSAISATGGVGHGDNWPTPFERRWAWIQKWTPWWDNPTRHFKLRYRIWLWRTENPAASEKGLPCVADLAMVLKPNGWAHRGGDFE